MQIKLNRNITASHTLMGKEFEISDDNQEISNDNEHNFVHH